MVSVEGLFRHTMRFFDDANENPPQDNHKSAEDGVHWYFIRYLGQTYPLISFGCTYLSLRRTWSKAIGQHDT